MFNLSAGVRSNKVRSRCVLSAERIGMNHYDDRSKRGKSLPEHPLPGFDL
jgi:hypothetical protein